MPNTPTIVIDIMAAAAAHTKTQGMRLEHPFSDAGSYAVARVDGKLALRVSCLRACACACGRALTAPVCYAPCADELIVVGSGPLADYLSEPEVNEKFMKYHFKPWRAALLDSVKTRAEYIVEQVGLDGDPHPAPQVSCPRPPKNVYLALAAHAISLFLHPANPQKPTAGAKHSPGGKNLRCKSSGIKCRAAWRAPQCCWWHPARKEI